MAKNADLGIPAVLIAMADATNSKVKTPFDASDVKALFFDVFGTCVDWRESITDVMYAAAQGSLNSATMSLATRIRLKASEMTYEDWGNLAQEWRNSYLTFTKMLAGDPTLSFKTVDQHHLDSLRQILLKHELILPRPPGDDTPPELIHDGSLWDEADIVNLSLKWHHLRPWEDSAKGIRALSKKYKTCTLSNGNVSLLQDLVQNAGLVFTHVYSAEMFQSSKPNSMVYLGACEMAKLRPDQCMMVAAHLDDLKHAKANGLCTMYVERPQEECHPELLQETGIVDIWIKSYEEGFISAAKRLGIDVSSDPSPPPSVEGPATKEDTEPVKE